MALIVQREITTSDSIKKSKPPICRTCRERREGLYTLDANGQPLCSVCAERIGRPI
jgi:formylmethanofuran dehydrogenase subunit E